MVRVALRDLIKFIEKENSKIYYTNFTDEILYVIENEGEYTTTDLRSYKKKVDEYIRNNINTVITILVK
jgi:type I restriction enzyme R subunit